LTCTIEGEPGEPALEGVIAGAGGPLAVVAPPHPLLGGELTNPAVQAVADGVRRAGFRSLLFNFRGMGESHGIPSGDPGHACSDYRAAVAAGFEVATVMVACGYSFGAAAAVAVAARDPRLSRVVAVAPPAALLDADDVTRLGQRLTIIAAERDAIALAADLERLAAGSGARFVVVTGADHFFGQTLGNVAALTEAALLGLLG
jgi:alpha/beta superfamily hydrolase